MGTNRMDDFLTSVRKQPVIGDGPMGTMLFSRFGHEYHFVEEYNLYKPTEVVRLHKDYVDAGAMILGASTYNANRIRLKDNQALDKLEEMNRVGIELAKEAAGGSAWVAGKMGTTGKFLEPLGDLSIQEAKEAFCEQAEIFVIAGADFIEIETMSDLREAQIAFETVRDICELPILVSFSFSANLHTMMGVSPVQAARSAKKWGVDIIGSNCGIGPDEVMQSIIEMKEAVPDQLYWSEPNAGLPGLKDGDTVYNIPPEQFSDYAEHSAKLGVQVISACCGATPDHIRAMAKRLDNIQ